MLKMETDLASSKAAGWHGTGHQPPLAVMALLPLLMLLSLSDTRK